MTKDSQKQRIYDDAGFVHGLAARTATLGTDFTLKIPGAVAACLEWVNTEAAKEMNDNPGSRLVAIPAVRGGLQVLPPDHPIATELSAVGQNLREQLECTTDSRDNLALEDLRDLLSIAWRIKLQRNDPKKLTLSTDMANFGLLPRVERRRWVRPSGEERPQDEIGQDPQDGQGRATLEVRLLMQADGNTLLIVPQSSDKLLRSELTERVRALAADRVGVVQRARAALDSLRDGTD